MHATTVGQLQCVSQRAGLLGSRRTFVNHRPLPCIPVRALEPAAWLTSRAAAQETIRCAMSDYLSLGPQVRGTQRVHDKGAQTTPTTIL